MIELMTTLEIELDDGAAGRLRHWAQREGIEPAALAARLLADITDEPDPFDFVGAYASDAFAARDADTYITEHGFGQP